jgi:NAD(P)-dependent dehydrogenase (short-subunit alcohol dehydrogenase family)
MDLKLKGKTAIVTGGSAGIGLAIVQALAAEGVTVSVPGRSKEKLDKALSGLGNVRAIAADVATVEGAQSLIQQVPDTDILINNLGVYEPKAFADITDADWLSISRPTSSAECDSHATTFRVCCNAMTVVSSSSQANPAS